MYIVMIRHSFLLSSVIMYTKYKQTCLFSGLLDRLGNRNVNTLYTELRIKKHSTLMIFSLIFKNTLKNVEL